MNIVAQSVGEVDNRSTFPGVAQKKKIQLILYIDVYYGIIMWRLNSV